MAENIKDKQAKLILYLTNPEIGVFRKLSDVAEHINIDGSNVDPKKTIENSWKEIQRKLSQSHSPIKFKLDYNTQIGSVALLEKVGAS